MAGYARQDDLEVEEIDDGHTPSSIRSAKQSTRGGGGPTAADKRGVAPRGADGRPECPRGHPTNSVWAERRGPFFPSSGACDLCGKRVGERERVMRCRECGWCSCSSCPPLKESGLSAACSLM